MLLTGPQSSPGRLGTLLSVLAVAMLVSSCGALSRNTVIHPEAEAVLVAWAAAQREVVLYDVAGYESDRPGAGEVLDALCRVPARPAALLALEHRRTNLLSDAGLTPSSTVVSVNRNSPVEGLAELFYDAAEQCAVDLEAVAAAGCVQVPGYEWDPNAARGIGDRLQMSRLEFVASGDAVPDGGFSREVYRKVTEACMLQAVVHAYEALEAVPPARVAVPRLYEAWDQTCGAAGPMDGMLLSPDALPDVSTAAANDEFLASFGQHSVLCGYMELPSTPPAGAA